MLIRVGLRRIRLAMTRAVLAIASMAAFGTGTASAQDEVVLQLRWDHQFQFAGYYAALWQGYYADAGLTVEIRSAITEDRTILNTTEEVGAGRAHFGIGSTDILLAADRGIPLRILASIFQQSGMAVVSRRDRNITSLADVASLRVARIVNDMTDIEFQAMLISEGINPNRVSAHGHDSSFSHVLNGDVDLATSYSWTSQWAASQYGVEFSELRPSTYGVEFYGDSIFTHQDVIDNDPELVDRFTEASIRGWEYALQNQDEIVRRIVTDLERRAPYAGNLLAFNRFQAPKVEEVTFFPLVDVGHMNHLRWGRSYQHMINLGMVTGQLNVDGLIFNLQEHLAQQRYEVLSVLTIVLVALLVFAGLFALWVVSLKRAVTGRTMELEQAKDRAEFANAVKSEFLSNVSHELRTPLNAILGFSELLAHQKLGPIGNPRYLEYVNDIHRSGSHLLDLVNDLLDLQRIETGHFELYEDTVDFRQAVGFVVDMQRPQAQAKGITLRNEIDPQLSTAVLDERATRQILLNLVSNGVKYTPKGGEVVVRARREGGMVAFDIVDNGRGIPKDRIRSLLQPFVRGEDKFTRTMEGSGLGLPIARLLTEAQGGTLDLESTVGVGTTAVVRLPLHLTIGMPAARPQAAGAGKSGLISAIRGRASPS